MTGYILYSPNIDAINGININCIAAGWVTNSSSTPKLSVTSSGVHYKLTTELYLYFHVSLHVG